MRLLWSKGSLFLQQQSNEKWDKNRNEMQLVYSNPKIESEMTIAAVHSSQMQFEKSRILQVLSDSAMFMEAEKRLSLAIKFLHVLLNDPQVLDKCQAIKVTLAIARVLLLKLAQRETMHEVIKAMLSKRITFQGAGMKLPWQERPHYLLQLLKVVPFLSEDGLLRIDKRLQNSDLAVDFTHPVLLLYLHWTTELYVKKAHCDYTHFASDLVFGM